jgi:hypothetical protein
MQLRHHAKPATSGHEKILETTLLQPIPLPAPRQISAFFSDGLKFHRADATPVACDETEARHY